MSQFFLLASRAFSLALGLPVILEPGDSAGATSAEALGAGGAGALGAGGGAAALGAGGAGGALGAGGAAAWK